MPLPPLPHDRVLGCLLGLAIGDAVGLAGEGLTRREIARVFGSLDRYRYWPGVPVPSDDTELACRLAESILEAGRADAAGFGRRLRRWILTLPAGIGFATLRAGLKLLVGFPATRSGVGSAGNGAAMRIAPLGLLLAGDDAALCAAARENARVTHTDSRAIAGAEAIAFGVARLAVAGPPERPEDLIEPAAAFVESTSAEMAGRLRALPARLAVDRDAAFAAIGVTGFVMHSVPAAFFAYLAHPRDGGAAVSLAANAGGDADTNAALAGALAGAALGTAGFTERLTRPWDRERAYFDALARGLAAVRASGMAQPRPRRAYAPLWIDRGRFYLPLPIHLLLRLGARLTGLLGGN